VGKGAAATAVVNTGMDAVAGSAGGYRSDALEAVHSAATGLMAIGAMDKQTMRQFDASCLVPPDLGAADVRRIRESVKVSQDVFARYLGTSKSTIQKWESAENVPNPFAQRLLRLIEKHGLGILT
jgi:putative transcriptional regulator